MLRFCASVVGGSRAARICVGIACMVASLPTFSVPASAQESSRSSEETRSSDDVQLYLLKRATIDPTTSPFVMDTRDTPGAVRGLRLRALHGRLSITNVRIRYADGTDYKEERAILLAAGERTRAINPTDEDRFVDSVELHFKPLGRSAATAELELIAHQTAKGRELERQPRQTAAASEPGAAPVSQPARVTVAQSTEAAPAVTSSISLASSEQQVLGVTTPVSTAIGPLLPVRPGRRAAIIDAVATHSDDEILMAAQRVRLADEKAIIALQKHIGKFSRIRLSVMESALEVSKVAIAFANGERSEVAIDTRFEPNQGSDWLDLKQPGFISEISVAYVGRPQSLGHARIELIGTYAPGWLGPEGEARKHNDGWVLLGSRTAGFIGYRSEIYRIGADRGSFRSVRIDTLGRAVTLNSLHVRHPGGDETVVPVRSRLPKDGTWGPLTISETPHQIETIEARYRSRFFDPAATDEGAAIVRIWAR